MDPSNSPLEENQPTMQIRRGMSVYDVNNDYVGKVELVHPGAQTPTGSLGPVAPVGVPPSDLPQVLPGAVIASNFMRDERPHAVGEETPAGIVADILAPDQLPPELEERLQQNGYLRIEGRGIFHRDRYVTLDQVASVTADGVLLRITRDGLIKP